MSMHSALEAKAATPMNTSRSALALRKDNWHLDQHRPGEGDATNPGGPVNWHEMEEDEYEETWGALCDFLHWALAHWNFTTDQIPTNCWWLHHDIIEELTAWWGIWQAWVRNPAAPIHVQVEFQTQTAQLKVRLEQSYRGRCRHEHQPQSPFTLTLPRV